MNPKQPTRHRARNRPPRLQPNLRFTPWAWAKLLFLGDFGPTEVGGFGITHPSDPALVTDLCLIPQRCTSVTVAFDDAAVADFFDLQVDQGRSPEQFARIWIHTHPGDSAEPSLTDERTFSRVFGKCDWAVMFIVARGGAKYARARFNTGPGGELRLPVMVDYQNQFGSADHLAWEAEYQACVRHDEGLLLSGASGARMSLPDDSLPDASPLAYESFPGFDPQLFDGDSYV